MYSPMASSVLQSLCLFSQLSTTTGRTYFDDGDNGGLRPLTVYLLLHSPSSPNNNIYSNERSLLRGAAGWVVEFNLEIAKFYVSCGINLH